MLIVNEPAEQTLARTPTKRTEAAADIDLEPLLEHDVVVESGEDHCFIGGVAVAHWRPSRGRRPLIR